MSTEVSYNGIYLQLLALKQFHREPVYDAAGNYLHTRYFVNCTFVNNPQATSYRKDEGNVAAPQAVPGVAAPLTDRAIRHKLSQPRQLLVVSIGGVEVLRSPDPNISTAVDALNGPLPRVYDVPYHGGQKTMVCGFAVETYVNECGLFKTTPSVVLSHTWNVTTSTDADAFSTRLIRGRLLLHAGRLRALGADACADDFRGWCAHPVPQNFQRVKVDVHATENPAEFYYSLQDAERPLNLSGFCITAGVTRVEAFYSLGTGYVGGEKALVGMTDALVRIGAAYANFQNPFVFSPGEVLMQEYSLMRLAYDLAPKSSHGFVVRVWGNRDSARDNLRLVAWNLLINKLGTQKAAYSFTWGESKTTLNEDLMGKFVELRADVAMGPIGTAYQIGEGVGAAVLALGPDEVENVTVSNGGFQPTLPYHNNTRGTYVGKVIARALAGECPTLAAPADPGRFEVRTA